MRIQNLVWFVVMLLGAQAYGQRSALITDLRLREAGGTGGDVTFRHNGDAVLRSYNAAGVETATWDAESGTFTGAYSGTIPADAITAGTFQPGVLIPATSVTGAFSSLSVTGSFSQPTDQVFEVAADGSRQYTTIQAAIAAATDPLVRKVILVYPGDYTLADGVQVVLAVDNTHLKGVSREGCRISGSYRQNADADGGLFLIDGNECSIDSLTITNTARAGYTLPTHACVVKLGNIDGDGTDNPRLANCTLIAKADSYPAGGADTVLVDGNATGYPIVENVIAIGRYDVISSAAEFVHIKDCIVHAETSAFWVDGLVPWGAGITAEMMITDTHIAEASYGFVFGSDLAVHLKNVTHYSFAGELSLCNLVPGSTSANVYIQDSPFNIVNAAGSGVTVNYVPLRGSGVNLTALNASSLASGTVPNARLDSDLTALGDNATAGILTRTGAGTAAARTITGTTNLITVTNGNGVSGNPTLTVGTNVARLDLAQTFTTDKTFNGNIGIGAAPGGRKMKIQGASPEVEFINTASGNKTWHYGIYLNEFTITETAVATRLTLNSTGAVIGGQLTSENITANATGITNHIFQQAGTEKLRVNSTGVKVTGSLDIEEGYYDSQTVVMASGTQVKEAIYYGRVPEGTDVYVASYKGPSNGGGALWVTHDGFSVFVTSTNTVTADTDINIKRIR